MFANHPDKASIKFVVVPLVREHLKSMNDIAMDVNVLVEKFAAG